jgi:hypothetical protein
VLSVTFLPADWPSVVVCRRRVSVHGGKNASLSVSSYPPSLEDGPPEVKKRRAARCPRSGSCSSLFRALRPITPLTELLRRAAPGAASRSTMGDASRSNAVALITQTTHGEPQNADFSVAGSGRARRLYCRNTGTPAERRGNASTRTERNLPAGPTPTPTNDGCDAAVLLSPQTRTPAGADRPKSRTGVSSHSAAHQGFF